MGEAKMTVKELMDLLKEVPEGAEVLIFARNIINGEDINYSSEIVVDMEDAIISDSDDCEKVVWLSTAKTTIIRSTCHIEREK